MNSRILAAYLTECLGQQDRAILHLEYSANVCSELPQTEFPNTEEALARIEAFTSRFARVVDIISKRVLRAIDQFEMYEAGTLLDVANRAEKRGLIDSVDWLRELKDTRNRISHDCAGDRLPEIFSYCRQELPELLMTCKRISEYGDRLIPLPE